MESCKMLAVLLVAVIFVTGDVLAKDCPTRYARFSDHHSYCVDPNPTCVVLRSGVKGNDKTEILEVHNEYRSKVATGNEPRAGGLPQAADMLELVWDDELAKIAQKWAAQCKFQHDCNECRTVENFYAGQNIAQADSAPCTSNDCMKAAKPDWKSMITMFYEEVKDFNKDFIDPFQSNEKYGHFSQVSWAKSWRVGCGFVAFENGNAVRSIYVCNYGPGGNVPKTPMYKIGDTCSACPSNTKCGTEGLCKVEDESVGPVYDEKQGNLLECNWKAGNPPCKVNIEGKKDWKNKRSLSGNYRTITLEDGEKTVMKMKDTITPNADTFCVVVEYRKGPADAANEDSSSMALLLYVPEQEWSTSIDMDYKAKEFTPFAMDIGWKMPTDISLQFSVSEGAPEHIFDVRDISVFDGKCSER